MKWQSVVSGKVNREYRQAFLSNDVNQARIIVALLAVWVLGYGYVDYLELGFTKAFYQLLILRIILFSASGGIYVRLPKSKNVNTVDLVLFAWGTALVLVALLSNASHEMTSIVDITLHYPLILGLYLLIPNRLIFKVILALLVTSVDIFVLASSKITEAGVASYTNFNGIITLVLMNIIGIILAIRAEVQRFKQHFVQKTLIDGRAELKLLATTDSLTGILNRRSFFEAAEIQFARFTRYQERFAFVVIDIDNLKNINDTYGHPAGDRSIRLMTDTINLGKRSSDIFGRLAGDEFGMLLPNTSVEEALEVLARIKSTLASLDVEARGIRLFKVSFSAGVTQVRESDKSFDDLYRRADKVLLAAKQSGRDRIEKI